MRALAIHSSPPSYHQLDRTQLAPTRNSTSPIAIPEPNPTPPLPAHTSNLVGSQPLPSAEDIFATHIPLVSHIPSRHRQAIAESYRTTIQNAIDAVEANNQAADEEFLKIFLFPSVILTNPSSTATSEQNGSSDTPTGSEIYKRRVQLWEEGKYQTLWNEAVRSATSRSSRVLASEEQQQANTKRALRLAKEGAYSKAAQALQSDGVVPPSAETSQALRAKHPQTIPPADTSEYVRPSIRPRFTPFTMDQVLNAVKKFRPGAAAGGSGLRPNHLDELMRVPYVHHSHSLRKEVTRLVNTLASGAAPRVLSSWIAGAPLTALSKRGPGIRPIAVGETIRRLVSSCYMARVGKRAASFLRPLQVGIATKGGAEATVHATRRLYDRYRDNSKYALLSVDFKNAFNLCSRNAFLQKTKELFPEILAWVEYCYTSDHAFLWTGNDMLRSVVGVQQGDPLGPLLFALALHPLLEKTQQLLSTRESDGAELAELLLQLWYLDDGYIIASHDFLRATINLLASPEATSRGLYLNMRKCRIWWPTPPPQQVQDLYPADLQQHYTEGTMVLQAPVGSEEFMEEQVISHVLSLQSLFDRISDLEDTQVAFQLLRNCIGVSKLSYILRTVPATSTSKGSRLYDKMMEESLRTILGGVLDPVIFRELQLPVQPLDKDRASLGLGLTSALSVSAASFLASAAASNDICKGSLPHEITALTTYNSAVESYDIWTSQCQQGACLPISDFCSTPPPSQYRITAPVHRQAQDSLPPPEHRHKCFLACLTHAVLGTVVPKLSMPTAITFCIAGMASSGYSAMISRLLLASDLSKAVRHPIVEHREPGHHRVRPDIAAIGSHGGTDFFDVTFVNSMAPSYSRVRHFNPLSSLSSAHREKHRRFEGFIQTAGEAAQLLPVPISATGGWFPASYSLLKTIAGAIATRAVEPFWKARNLLLQRHSALAVMSNAQCLLGGSQAPL